MSVTRTKMGPGGELHQQNDGAKDPAGTLTTNQGIPVSDDQNSLRVGVRGPTLLEDFVLREKIGHFDHERIPERIVHARGSGAFGTFTPYPVASKFSRAAFLADPGVSTEVFARFSTVAGGAGSGDLPRDVRGFAVKFYTSEGNFDLVGNNIPVFFIQDATKFPDLIHSVKMEADRGYPQAGSAHDTFWDFVGLTPESMHMLMWAMSDRAIPRSLRMMDGFGIHTFRMIDAAGRSTFVKFHWRPSIGCQSVLWDEAVKINGADPDFHRRDLFDAIAAGMLPEWELSVQAFDEATAASLGFDVLDPTKLIPEERVPLTPIGKMVLDRNPDNFFAETEQVAFCPANIVPGIDFSDDPLLQGRLFSYLDTQLSRLGGTNSHLIPVNRPRCPVANFQRDGHMQMDVPRGRASYEPNSLPPGASPGPQPRECPEKGFATAPEGLTGPKVRGRSASFSDHYSQARLFWNSMTPPEQDHIVAAFSFELGKLELPHVRSRMLGHLHVIHPGLGSRVGAALGETGHDAIHPAMAPTDLAPSPALSLLRSARPTLRGRKVAALLTDGCDAALLADVRGLLEKEGAQLALVAPKIAGVTARDGARLAANHALAAAPSTFFDAILVVCSADGADGLARHAAAVDWLRDAYGHCKVIGLVPAVQALADKAGVAPDDGVVVLDAHDGGTAFVEAARRGRIWAREPGVRPAP